MDRRAFLGMSGRHSGVAVSPESPTRNGAASLGALSNNRDQITSTLAPWVPSTTEPWDAHTINHLYRRAGFGATLGEIARAKALTPSAVIDALLDDALTSGTNLPAPPAYSDTWLHVQPYLGGDYATLVKQQSDYAYADLAIRTWWQALASQPKTMLRERMVLMWSNHFVVEAQKVYYPQMLFNYLDYFRQHPWGNFKQMVKDITIMPAMLIYLDGIYSYGSRPNENYARELMELFTLGVTDKAGNPNYTEADIQEIAKALTGWTIDYPASAPNVMPAKYDITRHDSRLKSPFGATKKNYGLASSGVVQDDVIDLLFDQKGDALAWYICSKLYQNFVYHDVTGGVEQGIITQMAQTFKNSNWELKPVLAQLLKSEHFFDEANIGASIKGPIDYMTMMMRSLDQPINALQAGTLYYYGVAGGQSLLDPPNVKGWPGYRSWISTTTLPGRNNYFAGPLINSSITGSGGDGYGNLYTGFNITDAMLTTWAKQFSNYGGKFADFLNEIAKFLCATIPSQKALNERVIGKLPTNYYEWPTLSDSDKIPSLRTIVGQIMLLGEYQLS
jgi:hypothetical protein